MTLAAIVALAAALIAAAAVLAAAAADIRRFEIPDGLSIAILATAVAYGFATPGFDWLMHLAATAIMFALGLLVFARGWFGGGDVKLLIAIAGWTGLPGLAVQLVAVALAGGLVALVVILGRRAFAGHPSPPRVFHAEAPVPYAVAIAAGTLWWAADAWPIG